MTTTINKKFELEEPIEKVWIYLADPTKIVTCVPGASLTEKIDDRNFKGQVAMKLGPVKVKFNGEVEIVELDKGNWTMGLKGKGLDSKGKGSADMKMNGLLNATNSGTAVDFTMTLTIVGKLAQFGSRLINEVTDHVLNQFVDNFKAKLAADTDFVAATDPTAIAAAMVDAEPASTQKVGSTEASTEEKAQALSDSAEAVKKALEDVQQAQAALDGNLVESLATAGAIATNGVKEVKKEMPKVTPPKAAADNSLNGFSLMMTLIKSWFSRLFGGK
ncbi:MAG: SRPBCC family protein [Saprospiraceae bacterium]